MKRHSHTAAHGYTLLEILAVAAIIVVLLALLFPVASQFRKKGENLKCLSNLRQLGLGINLYAAENDDRLPGPIGSGIGRRLLRTDTGQLIYHLQPYLSLPEPTNTAFYPEIMRCPSLRGNLLGTQQHWHEVTNYAAYSNNDLPNSRKFLKDRTVVDGNGANWPVGPWGRSNSSPPTPGWKRAWISGSIDETKLTSLGSTPTLSTIPAIREIDATLKAWPWPVPTRPVHGDHHNVLFFDWHVESVPVTAFK